MPAVSPLPVEGRGTAWQLRLLSTKGTTAVRGRHPTPSGHPRKGRGRCAQVEGEPRCCSEKEGKEEEEGSATRRGRKPDSCRGSSGGLLGAATRDAAVAEEKSLITRSAGRGGGGEDTAPGRAHPRPSAPHPPRRRGPRGRQQRTRLTCAHARGVVPPNPLPSVTAPPQPLHATRIRSLARPSAPPPTALRRRRLRRPSAISVGRRSRELGAGRRQATSPGQTRLYGCGAGAHAQTPSSLLSSATPPPASSSSSFSSTVRARPSSSRAGALVPPLLMPRESRGYGAAREEH